MSARFAGGNLTTRSHDQIGADIRDRTGLVFCGADHCPKIVSANWYPVRDLNPHSRRNCVLSAARLPFHQRGIDWHTVRESNSSHGFEGPQDLTRNPTVHKLAINTRVELVSVSGDSGDSHHAIDQLPLRKKTAASLARDTIHLRSSPRRDGANYRVRTCCLRLIGPLLIHMSFVSEIRAPRCRATDLTLTPEGAREKPVDLTTGMFGCGTGSCTQDSGL